MARKVEVNEEVKKTSSKKKKEVKTEVNKTETVNTPEEVKKTSSKKETINEPEEVKTENVNTPETDINDTNKEDSRIDIIDIKPVENEDKPSTEIKIIPIKELIGVNKTGPNELGEKIFSELISDFKKSLLCLYWDNQYNGKPIREADIRLVINDDIDYFKSKLEVLVEKQQDMFFNEIEKILVRE